MLFVFRLLFCVTALLCVAAAALITASLFIAERAPQSAKFLVISLCFSVAFLGLGWLVFGIQKRVSAIATIAALDLNDNAKGIVHHLGVLLTYLACGGAVLCLFMALLVYGILARIDQGFAVFG